MPKEKDAITRRNEDLLRLQRKLRERKSVRIYLHGLGGAIQFFIEPDYLVSLFESDEIKNIQQIVDEIFYTLEREDEALTSHRSRAEPERRLQLKSRTNDQVGRMVGELCQAMSRHHDCLARAKWTYRCAHCMESFATRLMLRGHDDLVHKKISVYGLKPESKSISRG